MYVNDRPVVREVLQCRHNHRNVPAHGATLTVQSSSFFLSQIRCSPPDVRFSPTASCSISRSIRLNSNWPETGPTERRPRSVPRSRHPNFFLVSLSVFRSLAYLCIILSRRRNTLEEEASSPAGQCAVSMEGERRDRFHIRVLTWRGRSLFVHTVLGVLENARKDSRSIKIPRTSLPAAT